MSFDPGGGLTGYDLTGFHEGHDTECWNRLGAIEATVEDTERGTLRGTRFSVWAPNAQAVRLVGDFNWWNGEGSYMHLVPGSGVWALFVEGVGTGNLYKFEVLGIDGVWRTKADPMARFAEAAPHTASIVYQTQYVWGDDQWMWYRGQRRLHAEAISIYEVHIGSWRQGLTYLELADQLVEYCSWQGYTHVEFLPVAQHPFEGSWGYHVTGYFAPMSKFGSPDEFRHLVDKLHQAGIGVLIDWVPGHFATDPWALQRFDGTALYEHEDPRLGWHPDWGSYIFNFGRNEVKSFLISNAYYWLSEYHIDGLRVDAVASMLYLDYSREQGQWVPNKNGGNENLEAIELLQRTNAHAYERSPGTVMIAEESTSWPGVTRPVKYGGLGFGFKWNMGWMNDSLRYLGREPIYRQHHHHEMTFAMAYAYSENFILPISHDEVVHGKGSMYERVPQDDWRKFATLRAFYSFMWAHPGKKLLFMGTEFGQKREFAENRSIDWEQSAEWGHRGLQRLIKDLNAIYKEHPALWKLDTDAAGLRLDQRRRLRRQRLLLPPLRRGGTDDRLPEQLLLRAAGGLPDRTARRRGLEGDLQLRRRGVRRHRADRQPGSGDRPPDSCARVRRLGHGHHPAAGCGLAAVRTGRADRGAGGAGQGRGRRTGRGQAGGASTEGRGGRRGDGRGREGEGRRRRRSRRRSTKTAEGPSTPGAEAPSTARAGTVTPKTP